VAASTGFHHTQFGWQTAKLRTHLGLVKQKADKSAQTPQTHAVDGIALAASQFVQYQAFHTASTHGYDWTGSVRLTPSPFRVIARPNLFAVNSTLRISVKVESESVKVGLSHHLVFGLVTLFKLKKLAGFIAAGLVVLVKPVKSYRCTTTTGID
jgi:hypothetical protein